MTPFQILGIPETATENEIKQAYRRLAQIHHPDKGGNPHVFDKIRKAFDQAMKPKVCPECHGKGHIRVYEGPITKKKPCPRCWS